MSTNLNIVNAQSDKNDPENLISVNTNEGANPYKSYAFPEGIDNQNSRYNGVYVQFNAFKYDRGFTRDSTQNASKFQYVVRLPFPFQGVSFNNSASYSTFSATPLFDSIERGFDGIKEGNVDAVIGAALRGTVNYVADKGKDFLLSKFPILQDPVIQQQFSSFTGLTFNPRHEMAFNGVGLRTYSFDYVFVPKNAREQGIIINIINQLEESFYPEFFDPAKVLLTYPHEFTISFYSASGQKVQNMPNIPDCSIVHFAYHINPISTNKFFGDQNDFKPSSYRLTFSLAETNQLTRSDIKLLRVGFGDRLGLPTAVDTPRATVE